jgi:hypothetical protein
MKTAVIFAFVLTLIGAGLFLFGVSRGIYSFEMTGFILTLPLTLIAAMGLAAILIGLATAVMLWISQGLLACAMAGWRALLWASDRASHRRTRG